MEDIVELTYPLSLFMAVIDEVSKARKKKLLFISHAVDQMNSPERMLSKDEIREVVTNGEIIEDYPDDPRGHSCLMSAETKEHRIVHVVCAPKEDYLAIITAYLPDPKRWGRDLKTRVK